MRLSIREEVAYNRNFTELREAAIAEAMAEIEMEQMLEEIVEYTARKTDDFTSKTETLKKEDLLKKGKDLCTRTDEICLMLDDLEKKLLGKNTDVSKVSANGTDTITSVTDGQKLDKKRQDRYIFTGEKDFNLEQNMNGSIRTCKQRDPESIKLENKEPEIERTDTADNISFHVSEANGSKDISTYNSEPKKTPKRRYLTIFTRRRKNKPKVMENKSKFSEKKTKNGESFLTRLISSFCCYRSKKKCQM